MANTTYTVKKGDTLSQIAVNYNTTVAKLVELNHIKDPDYIVVGQVLIVSGTASKVSTNKTSKAKILVFGLQSNTNRMVYATWSWDKTNTDSYQVKWEYNTGDKTWFIGSDTKVNDKQAVYTAPDNAEQVRFRVRPIAKKRKVKNKETAYWTASWSTTKKYSFADNPPEAPSAPTVKIEKFKLTASLENLDVNATHIQFQVVKNNTSVFSTGKVAIKTSYASYTCSINAGAEYKVRARSYRGTEFSDWSDYSSNNSTIPSTPSGITTCRANSETSVYLAWSSVNTATSYDIEYTTDKSYFDRSDQTTTKTGIEYTQFEVTGLESGDEYFFRIRAVNSAGSSGWSSVKSVVIGKPPAAPTTWSSVTTVKVGESLTLYWLHNAEDESKETYAELELITDGIRETYTIANPDANNDDKETEARTYAIDTTEYVEGTKLQWRVRTAGITKEYGDWSIQRTVDIYAPPTLELTVTDVYGEVLENLEVFPFYVSGLAGPSTQMPIGYHLVVTANESYETVDQVGNTKMVSAGEQVYSNYFDTNDPLLVELSAGNIDLENNITYTITSTVTMNSGLTATSSIEFTVAWEDQEYEPNAEIAIDKETLVAYIRPYCDDAYGVALENISLSVYRRNFDGGFTELTTEVDNGYDTFITDPHPSLDFARYRIVAIDKTTGAVSYCDIPGIPVEETAVVLQWNEDWTGFDTTNEDDIAEPTWAGSMLKLPYNIDTSDDYKPDVSLVEYVGRKHPVSYYGTHTGESSTWNVDIEKSDKETLYALRRLAIWMGDVYVREPSGSGYWANVTVSFSQTHCELTIPVTLNITRVEGGV